MTSIRPNVLGVSDQPEESPLRELFGSQREAFRAAQPDYAKRWNALDLLGKTVVDQQHEIARATDADFGGRAWQETLLLELAPLLDSIRHAKRHLAAWMKPRRVPAGIHFFPATARIVYQPLGVVGIIGAWNYPTLLNLSPMVDAIAAGNHAMLKPSELAPRTADLLRQLIASIFPREYIAVVTGDDRTAAAFASLPFDH